MGGPPCSRRVRRRLGRRRHRRGRRGTCESVTCGLQGWTVPPAAPPEAHGDGRGHSAAGRTGAAGPRTAAPAHRRGARLLRTSTPYQERGGRGAAGSAPGVTCSRARPTIATRRRAVRRSSPSSGSSSRTRCTASRWHCPSATPCSTSPTAPGSRSKCTTSPTSRASTSWRPSGTHSSMSPTGASGTRRAGRGRTCRRRSDVAPQAGPRRVGGRTRIAGLARCRRAHR